MKAPVCTDCHTAHAILQPTESEFRMQSTPICGSCHKDKLSTYHDTFHSQLGSLGGYVETARCWDCHGAHEILPASDPRSPINKANLVKTCGKCHAGANLSFVQYQPHANAHDRKLESGALFCAAVYEPVACEHADVLCDSHDFVADSRPITTRSRESRQMEGRMPELEQAEVTTEAEEPAKAEALHSLYARTEIPSRRPVLRRFLVSQAPDCPCASVRASGRAGSPVASAGSEQFSSFIKFLRAGAHDCVSHPCQRYLHSAACPSRKGNLLGPDLHGGQLERCEGPDFDHMRWYDRLGPSVRSLIATRIGRSSITGRCSGE